MPTRPLSRFAGLTMVALATMLLAGCGDTMGPKKEPVATTVLVTLAAAEVEYDKAVAATATVLDQDGGAMAGQSVQWSSLDPNVAAVSNSGIVSGTGVGTATIRAQAGSAQGTAEITVLPAEHALEIGAYDVTPYRVLILTLPPAVPVPAAAVPGVLGGDTLWFHPVGDRQIGGLVPETPAGSALFAVRFHDNHVGVATVTVQPPPSVPEPATVVDDLRDRVDAMAVMLEGIAAESDEEVEGIEFVRAVRDALQSWADTASVESKRAMALFIQANPALFDVHDLGALRTGPPVAPAIIPTCYEDAGGKTAQRRLVECKFVLAASITAVALGAHAFPATCSAGGPLCLASIAAVVGGFKFARHSARVIQTIPGIVYGDITAEVVSWFAHRGIEAGVEAGVEAGGGAGGGEFVSGISYTLVATAPHRSLIGADQARGGTLGVIIGAINALNGYWDDLAAAVDGLPGFIRWALPDLPPGPGPAPDTPAVAAPSTLPAEYLTIDGAAGVTAEYDASKSTLTVHTTQPAAHDFSLEFRYTSDIGTRTSPFHGTALPASTVALSSGNNQSALPGQDLAQPLVVRGTRTIDGAPLAGLVVEWTVTDGGGTVTETSTTDEDGYASAIWTLGDTGHHGDHRVEARGLYKGAPSAGGPVTFEAESVPCDPDWAYGTWNAVLGIPEGTGSSTPLTLPFWTNPGPFGNVPAWIVSSSLTINHDNTFSGSITWYGTQRDGTGKYDVGGSPTTEDTRATLTGTVSVSCQVTSGQATVSFQTLSATGTTPWIDGTLLVDSRLDNVTLSQYGASESNQLRARLRYYSGIGFAFATVIMTR